MKRKTIQVKLRAHGSSMEQSQSKMKGQQKLAINSKSSSSLQYTTETRVDIHQGIKYQITNFIKLDYRKMYFIAETSILRISLTFFGVSVYGAYPNPPVLRSWIWSVWKAQWMELSLEGLGLERQMKKHM